jgi:hypothetical protein
MGQSQDLLDQPLETDTKDTKDTKDAGDLNIVQDEQLEYGDIDMQKRQAKIDYSGAHEKIDPKEIALVRKLDRWIMVRLPIHQ